MQKDKNDSLKVRTSISIGPKIKAWADDYCKRSEKSLSGLIHEALREFLEKHDPKGKRK